MRGPRTTRDRDEEVLHWLRLRTKGRTLVQIAKITGYASGWKDIANLTDRVRRDDLKMSGEPAETVCQAYWTPRVRKS